jgi:hypothetical protein
MHGSAPPGCSASINLCVDLSPIERTSATFCAIFRLMRDESIYAGHQDHPETPGAVARQIKTHSQGPCPTATE